MTMQTLASSALQSPVSPLMLGDMLLRLAQDAERSGMRRPAERLLKLAYAVYEERPSQS